jgi:hypothetical protein
VPGCRAQTLWHTTTVGCKQPVKNLHHLYSSSARHARRLSREVLLKSDISSCVQLHVAGLGDVYKMQQPRKRGQWLVQARFDGLLTIMTPIWPDKENLALLLNQVRSWLSAVHMLG